MSQQNLSTTAATFKYPADLFAMLTVSSSLATAGGTSLLTTATMDTASAHGLTTGDTVIITGVTPAGYNGTYVVTVTDTDTFTYTTVDSGLAATSVEGNVNTFPSIEVGELVTAAGGGTAKVSGVVGTTKLRLKGVTGASSTWTGALTLGKSGVAGLSVSGSISYSNELSRIDPSDDTKKAVTEYTYNLTDKGYEVSTFDRLSKRDTYPNDIVSAVRIGKSKSQNTDASNAPVLTYVLPTAGNFDRSDTALLTFTVNSSESLSVTGTDPTLALLFFGSQAKTATFNAQKSDSFKLVFEYTLEGDTALGAMVSAGAVTGTIVDAGTATAVVPTFIGEDSTGIVVVA